MEERDGARVNDGPNKLELQGVTRTTCWVGEGLGTGGVQASRRLTPAGRLAGEAGAGGGGAGGVEVEEPGLILQFTVKFFGVSSGEAEQEAN